MDRGADGLIEQDHDEDIMQILAGLAGRTDSWDGAPEGRWTRRVNGARTFWVPADAVADTPDELGSDIVPVDAIVVDAVADTQNEPVSDALAGTTAAHRPERATTAATREAFLAIAMPGVVDDGRREDDSPSA